MQKLVRHNGIMKSLWLLILMLGTARLQAQESAMPPELSSLCKRFMAATVQHDAAGVIDCLDSAYRTGQYEGMFEGRTELFMNQFYSGYFTRKAGFGTIPFGKIKSIELAGFREEKGEYKLSFIVKSKKAEIQLDLTAVVRRAGGKTGYGLVGAWG